LKGEHLLIATQTQGFELEQKFIKFTEFDSKPIRWEAYTVAR
jgi:hypothetical protein